MPKRGLQKAIANRKARRQRETEQARVLSDGGDINEEKLPQQVSSTPIGELFMAVTKDIGVAMNKNEVNNAVDIELSFKQLNASKKGLFFTKNVKESNVDIRICSSSDLI